MDNALLSSPSAKKGGVVVVVRLYLPPDILCISVSLDPTIIQRPTPTVLQKQLLR